MAFLLWLLIIGLIAGAIARFVVPGSDPMGVGGTILLGIVGSLIGGTIAALIMGGDFDIAFANVFGSILGAIIALLIYRNMSHHAHV